MMKRRFGVSGRAAWVFGVLALVVTGWSSAEAAAPTKRATGPLPIVIDDGERSDAWRALPASGVEMKLTSEPGPRGRALRVDFEFTKGGGYAVLQRPVSVELPENYAFTFRMRGDCRPNNLEFKLLDASGENVWWFNRRDVHFPKEWTAQSIKKRQISFAWGPQGGGEIRRPAALEFAITAGEGGRGTVWFDDLALQPLPVPTDALPAVVARASSALAGHEAPLAADTDRGTSWRPAATDVAPSLELDLGVTREFGGLVLDWARGVSPPDYVIEGAGEDGAWRELRVLRGSDGGRDYLGLPESEARILRWRALGRGGDGWALEHVEVQPLEWAANHDALVRVMASEAERGNYPRAYLAEQSYWTVVGVDRDREEGLLDEDGRLEVGRGEFAIEPFLRTEAGLRTWADARTSASLADGDLPIPTATWSVDSLQLSCTAFALGDSGASALVARYRLTNRGSRSQRVELLLAVRPYQTNPPSQFLNGAGGAAIVRSIELEPGGLRVNGDRRLRLFGGNASFGGMTFDEGDFVARLREGPLPAVSRVDDPIGRASGALGWTWTLSPGQEVEVALAAPWGAGGERALSTGTPADWQRDAERGWRGRVDVARIELGGPGADVAKTLRAQLGFVLVNRDGAGIQPGSRSYERSWIRDGSLTSSALLRMGLAQPVREYVEWFAPYQYADGKVPCCVDRRGSDPVPENDSHGQLVFLLAEYLRLTGDRTTVERLWPHARAALVYMDTLRAQRRTPEWASEANRHFYGLLPPSISHEGYSAKPMHSYWDDLFALRGYKDGAWLARTLGRADDARWIERSRDEFAGDFGRAARAAMAKHRIDYVPGCSDLGDFDATSTTIALSPAQADDVLPADGVKRTFERYWEFFDRRRRGVERWDAYTPYELRNVGAFVRLGWKDKAHELLDWFLHDRRLDGWRQWAEVVDRSYRHVRFLGDMPHTWVGTDFVRSVLDMLAWERERDDVLVLASGVPAAWTEGAGVRVAGLRTRWGSVAYELRRFESSKGRRTERGYEMIVASGVTPPGGIEVRFDRPWSVDWGKSRQSRTTVNGRRPELTSEGWIRVRQLPATIRWVEQVPAR